MRGLGPRTPAAEIRGRVTRPLFIVSPLIARGAPSVNTSDDQQNEALGIFVLTLQSFFAAFSRSSFLAITIAPPLIKARETIVSVMSHPIGSILFSMITSTDRVT